MDFILEQRSRYGDVPVIIMAKIQYSRMIEELEQRVADRNINQVYTYFYDAEYLGCNWHPTVVEHEMIANELVEKINLLSLL
ncbi:hypothetical protein AT251_21270 [Enterovibrio nigricans]|nr:hypothetical protein [Enterovibrio nigricans]PKF49120.1 hypothetical protein AT251_21270 [Enterovibrio nigricans]